MAENDELKSQEEAEGIFINGLKDMLRRLNEANGIVLALAQLEVSPGFFNDNVLSPLINKARKYVAQDMTYAAGVPKLVKSWGMKPGKAQI